MKPPLSIRLGWKAIGYASIILGGAALIDARLDLVNICYNRKPDLARTRVEARSVCSENNFIARSRSDRIAMAQNGGRGESANPAVAGEKQGAYAPSSIPNESALNAVSLVARLEAMETPGEMNDAAGEIVGSGRRADILELFAAIEFSKGDKRDILARNLQLLNSQEMGPDLLDFLIRNADDPVVADQARDALARIIAPEDISRITQSMPSESDQPDVRSHLAGVLARIGNPDAVDELTRLCEFSKDSVVHSSVATALGAIGTPEAVGSLMLLIDDLGIVDIHDPIAQALMSAANKDSRGLLQGEFLTATNPVIRYATAYALGTLSNQALGTSSPLPAN